MTRSLRSPSGDRGVTLVELMITMILLGVVTTITVSTMAVITRATVNDRSSGESLDSARIGMDFMTRAIRSGSQIQVSGGGTSLPAFAQTGPETMTLYANVGSTVYCSSTGRYDLAPTKIAYTVTTGRSLVETRWEANACTSPYFTFPTTATTARTIATNLVSGGTALFQFLSAAGPAPSGTAPPSPAPTVSPQTAGPYPTAGYTTLVSIRGVLITLTVDADPTLGAAVTLSNTVMLPNLAVVTT